MMKTATRASTTPSVRPGRRGASRPPRASSLDILLVVDGTDASRQALQYVGRVLAGRDRVACHLAYIAPHMPPELLETVGSESPEREEQIEAELRLQQSRWTAAADKKAERILREARTRLRRAGVSASHIRTCVSPSLDPGTAADEVLLLARAQGCGTVVVGHRAHSWFRAVGGAHLAEQLVRRAKGFAVWVID
jgi:nucleotide-binding universal stress UspA family protein